MELMYSKRLLVNPKVKISNETNIQIIKTYEMYNLLEVITKLKIVFYDLV